MEITNSVINEYLVTLEPQRLQDAKKLIELGQELTGQPPKMWGTIVGFGSLHYRYESGHQGDMPLFSFSSRKKALTIYLSYDLAKYPQLNKLGKFSIGKGCLYVKQLIDINFDVLKNLAEVAIKDTLALPFITINK